MNKVHYHLLIKNKKAITLMEIMLAVVILAFTFIPVIGTILASAKDTDIFNSYVFAQTTARNILDTLIDDVPFHSIKEGSNHVAEFVNSTIYNPSSHTKSTYDVSNFVDMITNIRDKERGIDYKATIYVFPITASDNDTNDADELKFVYLTRPEYDKQDNWFTYKGTFADQGCRLASQNPYDDAQFPCTEKIENAHKLGAVDYTLDGSGDHFCIMKKIVLTLEWTARDNHKRKIALYTFKANLDSEQ